MKDSGVEWIGKIPEHWEIFSYNLVSKRITYGFTNPMPSTDEGPWMITAKDIKNEEINYETARKTEQESFDFQISKKSKPKIGTVLITKDGTLGETAIVDSEFVCINQSVASLESNEKILPKFLQFSLLTNYIENCIKLHADVSTMGHISISDLAKWKVCVPSIKEQEKIIEFLNKKTSKIDFELRKNQQVVTLLNEKRKSLINQAVTKGLDPLIPMKYSEGEWIDKIPEHWKKEKLSRIASIIDSRHYTPEYMDKGIPHILPNNVTYNGILFDRTKFTNEKDYSKLIEGDRRPEKGDIILTRNASVGISAIVDTDKQFSIGQDMVLIKSKKIHSELLFYILNSDTTYSQIEIQMVGATFKRINVEHIRNLKIIFSENENGQKEIVEYIIKHIDKIENNLSKTKRIIQKYHEYRQSLITSAVTGKIDVTSLA